MKNLMKIFQVDIFMEITKSAYMTYLLLIPFFIIFCIYIIYSKPDLYAHEHDASINKEIENFNANFKALENLKIENNYFINNNHVYNNK